MIAKLHRWNTDDSVPAISPESLSATLGERSRSRIWISDLLAGRRYHGILQIKNELFKQKLGSTRDAGEWPAN